VLRNAGQVNADALDMKAVNLHEPEKKLLELLYRYPAAIKDAGQQMSPGVLANYAYEVAKAYNHFYHELSILKESNTHQRLFRIMLCTLTAHVIKSAFAILGIQVPERM
jgi:arginyl-tRNA synthetase